MVDLTTIENRTKRIAILDTFFLLGLAVGLQLSGIIRNYFGWVALFATSSTVLVINILYVVFKIKEGKKLKEELHKDEPPMGEQAKGTKRSCHYVNKHCLINFDLLFQIYSHLC